MEINWDSITVNFHAEENNFSSHDLESQKQPESTIQTIKRSRQEMEEEVFVFEVPIKSDDPMDKSIVSIAYQVPTNVEEPENEEFNPDDFIEEDVYEDEVFEDDEDVILSPKEPLLKFINAEGKEIYYCESCSLDFPTEAYIIRHQDTKKHRRALRMEQRGKKVNQKRKYVRKNAVNNANFQVKEVKPLNFQIKKEVEPVKFQVNNEVKLNSFQLKKDTNRKITDMFQIKQRTKPILNQTQFFEQPTLTQEEIDAITNLTPEEIELLHFIDDEIFQMESEKTAKNFYENFNFDLDCEDEEPVPKVKQFLTVEEIMADLIASSEPYLNEQAPESNYLDLKPEPVVINLPIFIPQDGQQFAQVQSMVQIQHQPLAYVNPQPTAQVRSQQKVQPIQKVPAQEEQPKQPKIHCQMCPRTFNLRCHLTQHMNIVHSGNRNLKCPKCGKKYAQQEQLDQHMEKHLGDKPFKCTKCDKSYNNKVDLKRHTKTHEEVKDFICKYCGGGFVRSDHLEKHLTIHLKHNRTELGDRIRSRKGLPLKNAV